MRLFPFAEAYDEAVKSASTATEIDKKQAVMFLCYAISILEGNGERAFAANGKVIPFSCVYESKADFLADKYF
jgi:hypothetical protein